MPFPLWLAWTNTVPAPVMVSELAETVAGPEMIEKLTVSPEEAVAESVIVCEGLYVALGGVGNVMLWLAWFTWMFDVPLLVLKLLSPE